jgi:hypothetical protein
MAKQMKLLVIVCALALASLACTVGGLSIDSDSAEIEVEVTETQINNLLARADSADVNPDEILQKITSVEFEDGYLTMYGETAEGVEGSLDVSVTAEDDELKAEIIAVDIEGYSMDDERVVNANQEITDALTKSVEESNGEVRFKDVTVEKNVMRLRIQVMFEK